MQYEDRITIRAPEGIELHYPLAGLGSRFLAELLDLLLRGVVLTALIVVLRLSGAASWVLGVVLIVCFFLAVLGYDIAFEVWAAGRTPGKRGTGLRVLRTTGQPVTFGPSAVRNLMRIIDIWVTVLLAGIISILVTKKNQRLGDLAAGTIVVRERRPATAVPALGRTALAHPGLDVTAVSASELAAIRDFLARRDGLTPDARDRVSRALADGVRTKVGGLPPGGLPPEPMLEVIAAAKAGSR